MSCTLCFNKERDTGLFRYPLVVEMASPRVIPSTSSGQVNRFCRRERQTILLFIMVGNTGDTLFSIIIDSLTVAFRCLFGKFCRILKKMARNLTKTEVKKVRRQTGVFANSLAAKKACFFPVSGHNLSLSKSVCDITLVRIGAPKGIELMSNSGSQTIISMYRHMFDI